MTSHFNRWGTIIPVSLDPAIRSLIGTFRRSPNWDEELDLKLLQQLWPVLVGDMLGKATTVNAIHDARVVLNVPDPQWRRQLARMKRRILQKINEPWGSGRFTEVEFTCENK